MSKLVRIENGQPVTDSLIVAEIFGKEHKNVLRDIETLECSSEFSRLNFEQSDYTTDRGRSYPKFIITQDGFSFLVMGYTGKEAARFKEMYIGEFNRMRQQIAAPLIPQSLSEALFLAATLAEEKEALQLQAAADRPKVVFAEALVVSEDSILIADLAKLLKQNLINVGEIRLFKMLRNEGYLIKGGSEYNMPTQRSMDLGIMEIKVGQRGSASEGVKMTRTPKITGKGCMYFINKYKERRELRYDNY
ncbi:Rha family transcriptional regulator [Bacillus sp. FJAT-26390]|uniref:Rha family transcriptional regulator n=1 Tax=Bacillus sp. FJAT-26390 TaxID=1743142 RepID=UPI000807ADF5|nr:Rha family transcriptional regulator [Bacillus sp. FJAT-26390]OBZ08027.1 hypothetical protein A7975_27240 [Bacillus sp. FJAT-26390]